MKRPGVRFLRWNKPAHLSRTSTSSMFRSFQSACLQRRCYRNQCSVRNAWNKLAGDTSAMRRLAARRNVTEKLEAKETHQAARRRAHLAGANELGKLVHLGPHEAAVLLQFELLRLVRLLVQRPGLPHIGLSNSEGC